ncbi:MAG: hypothetical protein QF921_07440 [Pseudomonadales bacterium]|nr:hypothetical protein [Pseudomonadales bacterium]MDP6469864.1 hypothetical protein [Pseudomonadales bacterium]MDP6827534.1 hypothetical protein [Pseudomonadales bacterium]MDP6971334.1 hypothetical protein [Pseudomonadales bacterium]
MRWRCVGGFEFFSYVLGSLYGFGEHKPGRTDLWKEFQAVRGAQIEQQKIRDLAACLDAAMERKVSMPQPADEDIPTFVALGRRITEEDESATKKAMLGIVLGNVEEDGVSLVGVTPGGGAQAAGMAAGDKITVIAGMRLYVGGKSPPPTLKDVMHTVEPGEGVLVEYVRDGDGRASRAEVVNQAHREHVMPSRKRWSISKISA